jgi:hypothetical protein
MCGLTKKYNYLFKVFSKAVMNFFEEGFVIEVKVSSILPDLFIIIL